jgi:hypothetical protein
MQIGVGVKGTLQLERCYKNVTEQSIIPHETQGQYHCPSQMAMVNLGDRLGSPAEMVTISKVEKHC